MEKYEKLLALMQSKPGGRIQVDDPELVTLLGDLLYRTPTYVSCIRRLSKLEVRGIREGRKVVAYELVALAPEDTPLLLVEEPPSPTPAESVPAPVANGSIISPIITDGPVMHDTTSPVVDASLPVVNDSQTRVV